LFDSKESKINVSMILEKTLLTFEVINKSIIKLTFSMINV
jgi:hypothetical protein